MRSEGKSEANSFFPKESLRISVSTTAVECKVSSIAQIASERSIIDSKMDPSYLIWFPKNLTSVRFELTRFPITEIFQNLENSTILKPKRDALTARPTRLRNGLVMSACYYMAQHEEKHWSATTLADLQSRSNRRCRPMARETTPSTSFKGASIILTYSGSVVS